MAPSIGPIPAVQARPKHIRPPALRTKPPGCNLQNELFASFEQVLALADRRGEPYARIVLENSGVAEPHVSCRQGLVLRFSPRGPGVGAGGPPARGPN